jgi:aminoglycoside phosphotransferase (APT) family kinase protein
VSAPAGAAQSAVDWANPAAVRHAGDRLARWLETRLPDATDVTVERLVPPTGSGGFSNLALLVDATWTGPTGRTGHELFARVELPGPKLVHTFDLAAEARLLDALHRARTVPVPAVLGYESDPAVLGTPFAIMQRAHGRVMPDNPPFTAQGWVLDLDPTAQARHHDAGLQVLADIATIDWQTAGLDFLDRRAGGSGIDERMQFLTTLLTHTAAGRDFPLHNQALTWLHDNPPPDNTAAVLSWGDARIGNLMYAHDKAQVTSVLDWEHATIGNPQLDLGWWLYSNRIYSHGFGLPLPPGFPDRTTTINRYHQLTGHHIDDIDWYEAWAGTCIAIIMIGIADRLVAAGTVPTDAGMQHHNPVTIALTGLLDLPPPPGTSTSWA